MTPQLLQKHKPSWAQDFLKISKALQAGLKGIEVQIEHIGSTSITGLDAKEIIDIDIIYKEDVPFFEITERLVKIGYFHNGDQGIKDREAFKRAATKKRHGVLDVIQHHLYVCPSYSVELQRHLLFRDYLRLHKYAREYYEEIKYKLAIEANQDRKIYADLKQQNANGWIDSIIAKAKKEFL